MLFHQFSRKICLIVIAVLLAVLVGAGFALGSLQTLFHVAVVQSGNTSYISNTSSMQSVASQTTSSQPEENPQQEPENSSTDSTSSETVSVDTKPKEKGLVITTPSSLKATVMEPAAIIEGTSDTAHPLTMDGADVPRDENGKFSVMVNLEIGKNSFVFEHKGTKKTCTITYKYTVIRAYNPSVPLYVEGGSQFIATVSARAGSKAYAEFNGEKKELQRTSGEFADEDFCDFNAIFDIPEAKSQDINLGKVKFTAEYKGVTDTYSSGNITCKKVYIPQIAEVVISSAETFDGNSTDNWTRPTNNYLPEGTVDYVTGSFSAQDGKYLNNFLILRCGKRIYTEQVVTPGNGKLQVSKVYDGKLPDHNELSVSGVNQESKYTKLILNTNWKAPFFLDYLPQSYSNAGGQDYTVSSFTAKYVEIKFCYATVFNGTIDFAANNPLFSHSEIIRNADNTVVRLYFKKQGAFYGWDCYYNSSNQLVFEFRHPATVSAGSNEYAVNLTGTTILVDAGHGGIDPGACSGTLKESERNLSLAYKIKAELEKTGATVIMLRTDDSTIYSNNRVQIYRQYKPDFMVSVHHDSSTASGANGFGSYYTTPFSQSAAHSIYLRTMNTGIYQGCKRNLLGWHYFYMSRMTYCPSVLTENGYMSGSIDRPNIANNDVNTQKAKAIAMGIADYFRSLI